MDERRTKGLCFLCDERYHAQHACPKKELMILIVKKGGEEEEFDGECVEVEEEKELAVTEVVQSIDDEIPELAELS